jgi:hypothetical protein
MQEEQIIDIGEVNVRFPFRIWWLIGIEWIFVIIGSIGGLCSGAIPLVFYLLIGKYVFVCVNTIFIN